MNLLICETPEPALPIRLHDPGVIDESQEVESGSLFPRPHALELFDGALGARDVRAGLVAKRQTAGVTAALGDRRTGENQIKPYKLSHFC